MLTDTEIKTAAFRALVDALGDVQAERFIALIRREPFDYTQWHRTLWPDRPLEEWASWLEFRLDVLRAVFRLVIAIGACQLPSPELLPSLAVFLTPQESRKIQHFLNAMFRQALQNAFQMLSVGH